jgi:hypothetical protein
MTLVEEIAREIHASHKLKKPWDHPDTKRIWHPVCYREARAALRAYGRWKRRSLKDTSQDQGAQ